MQVYYPPVGFYFKLEFTKIKSAGDAAFQEVSGLSAEVETEEIAEGGENRFKYKLPSFRKYSNLVLKRGLVTNKSPLASWCQGVMLSDLANPINPKDITLTLFNEKGQPSMVWNFVNAWPVKLSISDLKSQENELVIESIEFAYSYFKQV